MADLVSLLGLVERAPGALRLGAALQKARNGDGDALSYLIQEGWKDALGLHSPELRQAGESAVPRVLEAVQLLREGLNGNVIEGEVVDTPPWADFARHLHARAWSVTVIYGAKGFGKSQLGLKLAYSWAKRHGYQVELAGAWPEDRPSWARPISMKRLVARTMKVARYLDQADDSIDDGMTEEDLVKPGKKAVAHRPIAEHEIDALRRRITVVDEAAVFFSSISAAGQQASRDAARTLNNQMRHLNGHLILICQNLSEMPRALRASSIQFFKFAPESVIRADYRTGEKWESVRLWQEAIAGLAAVKTGTIIVPDKGGDDPVVLEGLDRCALAHNWWPDWPTIKAWAYVMAGDIGGHTYRGPAPCSMLTAEEFRGEGLLYGEEEV